MMVDRFVGLAAFYFYVLCWFVEQPYQWLKYIGISLPWLSLFLSLPLGFIWKNGIISWGISYAVWTLFYVVVTIMYSGNVIVQTPYLACCVCFIASVYISKNESKLNETTEEYRKLHEKDVMRNYYINSLMAQEQITQTRLKDIADRQEENIDEQDEVIRIANSRVILKKLKTMLDELSEISKINKELCN